MASSIYVPSPHVGECLCQGEILSGIIRVHLDIATVGETSPGIQLVEYPYAVVLTQACDLAQDFRTRSIDSEQVPNVLFCDVRTGTELYATVESKKAWDKIRQNYDPRYHFLEEIPLESDATGLGVPELSIDFKRYFTVPTSEVYARIRIGQTLRRSVLTSPYVEHLSQRFAYFLSRIGLPEPHSSQ